MRVSYVVALTACVLAALAHAEDATTLPAFAIYRAVDAKFPEARPFTFESPEGKPVGGHYDPKPIVLLKDVFELQAIATEYGAQPWPGLGVRFTNDGNRAVALATSKEDQNHFVIVAGRKVVGQIEGAQLWKIGTARLKMLITLPRDPEKMNRDIAREVNEAKKKNAP